MKPRQMVDRILKRRWTGTEIEKYLGKFDTSWLMYAADDEIRGHAASGGTITALLAFMLETGQIDGALVLSLSVKANELVPRYEIATSREMLMCAQGSKYMTTRFTHDAVPLIKAFPGRLAMVLLPCDTWVVNRLRQNDRELSDKIVLRIVLFCGHVSDPGLSRMVIQKNKRAGVSLTDFRFRQGHWRGQTRLSFEDNTRLEKPFSTFSDYQNLYFYCARKCLSCHDHGGYDSDVSVGDVWLMAMKDNPIKHNAVIVRNQQARQFIDDAMNSGYLTGKQVPIETIADAQSRSLPLHYNVSARSAAGRFLGFRISDPVAERVRLVDFLIACILLYNFRMTLSAKGRARLKRVRRPIIKLYLYLLKALEVW